MSKSIADFKARQRALDPVTSFIVQAPAGSGKTGLLTQRYLVLLCVVNTPEEIIAITFTRKAASEMRQRILQALEAGQNEQPPENEYDRQTWELARAALARDAQQGWTLLENSERLRIMTIDSLCASLAGQMPVLSRFGSTPKVTEDADRLYRLAANNTLDDLDTNQPWSNAIAHLIRHLDNRLNSLELLIANMLARRDQWLRHLANSDSEELERHALESAITRLVTDQLRVISHSVPENCKNNLVKLASFAAENMKGVNPDSPICACENMQRLPGSEVADRVYWDGISELLLTQSGSWRAKPNKNQGFPPASQGNSAEEKALYKTMKADIGQLLESLCGEDNFLRHLSTLRYLPEHKYTESEWKTLHSLIQVLRVAAAHLELVFRNQGEVDFPALSQAASRALGTADEPTDLALALDYRIQHLLVDEFQDTSLNQYQLLQGLTAGWQNGDGHSLFVVGDPMQSIYRFREAEVSLFLDVKRHGIGALTLEPLLLSVNFRSQQGIVDWINQCFPYVMPTNDDASNGAVSYSPSVAFNSELKGEAVTVHPTIGSTRDNLAEADRIVSLIQQARQKYPQGTTAILVRGRNHLIETIDLLNRKAIHYQAIEISRLSQRPVIQDLMALTLALIHRADRVAWLSILRAPYCGLSLKDIYLLVGNQHNLPVVDLLNQWQNVQQLSADACQRICRILPHLNAALMEQQRRSLRSTVEGVWLTLGGPACISDKTAMEDAEVYLRLLDSLDLDGQISEPYDLIQRVNNLFSKPDVEADSSLQLMTIHKAKGLEFDTVILPGLDRVTGRDSEKLLDWMVLSDDAGKSDLFLAPIKAQSEEKNRLAGYLQIINRQRSRYEDSRLLYVAATRARRRLHLLSHIKVKETQGELSLVEPKQDSLLARMWPVVQQDIEAELNAHIPEDVESGQGADHTIPKYEFLRLDSDWRLPTPPESVYVHSHNVDAATSESIEYDWASETARHIGTVVHRLLQHIGNTGIEKIESSVLQRMEKIARDMLIQSGIPQNQLSAIKSRIIDAVSATLEDKRGQWILSGNHKDSCCEMPISASMNKSITHMIIDRTFIDEEGTRWIIDYKTGAHDGSGIDAFLDREQERYREQLERYAMAMSSIGTNPIRLGLYFPLHGEWRSWLYHSGTI